MKITPGFKFAIKARLAKQPNGPIQPTVLAYRGKAYLLMQCSGDAHSAEASGFVDNCMQCAPLWGVTVQLLGEAVDRWVEWAQMQLIPDLRESQPSLAQDFEHAIVLMRALQGGK